MNQGKDDKDFAKDVDATCVGFVLVAVDGHEVEIDEEEEAADDYCDYDEKSVHSPV